MTIWRMRIACWITRATNTHIQHAIRIAFPQQQLLQEGAFVFWYTYIALNKYTIYCTYKYINRIVLGHITLPIYFHKIELSTLYDVGNFYEINQYQFLIHMNFPEDERKKTCRKNYVNKHTVFNAGIHATDCACYWSC
jgi:hypothetical protein